MNKKTKNELIQIIKDEVETYKNINKHSILSRIHIFKNKYNMLDHDVKQFFSIHSGCVSKMENILVNLNNLLDIEDRIPEVVDIEKEMKKIQTKKYITTKEFKEIYNVSINSQAQYRGRSNDPLPYHQKKENGKITYYVEEVEKWLENQHK